MTTQLTKHCYVYSQVLDALQLAIQTNQYKEILFWVHELIESGLAYPCWQWLMSFPSNPYAGKDDSTWEPEFCYTMALRIARPNSKLIIMVEHSTAQNMFPEPTEYKTYHYLKQWHSMYPYKTKNTTSQNDILGLWKLYLSETPYWKELVEDWNGKFVGNEIIFDDEDQETKFWNRFDYELDEQSLTIQQTFGWIPTK